MENATRRIRKARRQGLAAPARGLGRSPRVSFRSGSRNEDLMATSQPNRQRKTRVTQRKAKRQAKSPARSKR